MKNNEKKRKETHKTNKHKGIVKMEDVTTTQLTWFQFVLVLKVMRVNFVLVQFAHKVERERNKREREREREREK